MLAKEIRLSIYLLVRITAFHILSQYLYFRENQPYNLINLTSSDIYDVDTVSQRLCITSPKFVIPEYIWPFLLTKLTRTFKSNFRIFILCTLHDQCNNVTFLC